MASSAGEGTSYEGGGVGGKFRKRPLRKTPSTPYDRPPTTLRNPNTDGGWFSKIITPASKLVTSSAQLFFSSLLRKRIAPPPQQSQPEIDRESTESDQEAVQISPRVHQSAVHDQKCLPSSFDGSGISELEQTLKQRTFTRSELNHLMDLLHSRTNELPVKDKEKIAGTSQGLPILPTVILDKVAGSPVTARRGSYLESQKSAGWISSPAINPQVLEENVSSPAELAKAYMGNRTSEVSPSMLSFRGQVQKEDAMLRNIVPFSPKTSAMSLVRTTGRAAIPENGFITPRSLGRSAIYNMARTPYSKVHPASSQKTLKRRSAMEDDEYGSVGPIRRLRQKTNLSTTNSINRFVARTSLAGGIDSDAVQDPSSSKRAVLSLDESGSRIPLTVGKSGKGIRGASYTSIPSKSTAVATRILEQLDKLVPKEQSPQAKLDMLGKSHDMLTTDMQQGPLRSPENVDSSQILQGLQDPQIRGSFSNTYNDATSRKQYKVEENGEALHSEKNTFTSIKRTSPSDGIATPVKESVFQPLNKRGFQMSAHEHSWDMGDDTDSNEAARKSVTEGKGKLEELVAQSKSSPTEALRLAKSPTSETKSPINPVTQKTTGFGSFSAEKIVAFKAVAPHPPATTSDPKVADIPLFSFSSKHVDKVPCPQFSVSPEGGTSNTKSNPPSDIKVASTNSFPVYSSGAADNTFQISASDKGKNMESKATAEVMSKSVPSFSVPVPISTTAANIFGLGNAADKLSNGEASSVSSGVPTSSSASSIFTFSNLANKSDMGDKNVQATTVEGLTSVSTAIQTSTSSTFKFGNPESKPIISNGLVASSSSPMAFSTSSALGSFTNGFSQTANSSVSTPNGAINPITTPSTSLFKFGGAPSSSSASEAVSTDLKSKNEKEATFGNLIGAPAATAGNNIFGSTSTVPSSSSFPGTWPSAEKKSTPFQFGESSSAVFGNSTNSSPFGSSSQNIFGSSMGGVGANTSSTNTSSTTSMFGSSTGFVFGQSNSSSAAAAATVSNSPMGFGSVFSFTSATPTATASTSQALPNFGSSFPSFTTSTNNNIGDQMNMDSSMNEDIVQSSLPVFSQQPPAASPFQFGSTAPSAQPSNPFQFGQVGQSNPPPPAFQASGIVDFSGGGGGGGGGGSFSLGTGGDKSNRKFIKVKHKNRKK
ncbi:nuclear pore complex protein NUP1-like [Impatiens glandulifera]|uniref:nuclear pore complex protein NUP1-like n=1 Tax=Impatiens glandulifera TaxID=253017 RepID=UPI001FB15CFB|nr:nuclear pore complex protein NUP1-like [Impatiens glandulifera]XP_047325421.1 nuclear pore complex protein NUP1-like [Impatiens glandulifera]